MLFAYGMPAKRNTDFVSYLIATADYRHFNVGIDLHFFCSKQLFFKTWKLLNIEMIKRILPKR